MENKIKNFLNAYLLPDSIVVNTTETYTLANRAFLEKYFPEIVEDE